MLKTTIAAAAAAGIILLAPGGRVDRRSSTEPMIPHEELVPFPQLEDPTGPPAARDLVIDEFPELTSPEPKPLRLFGRLRDRTKHDDVATGDRHFLSRLRERFKTWRATRAERRADPANGRPTRKHRFRRGILPSSNDRPTGRRKQHGRDRSPWGPTKRSDPHAGPDGEACIDALRTGRDSDALRPGCKLTCAPARLQAG